MSKVVVVDEHRDVNLDAAAPNTVSATLALKPDSIDIAVLAAGPVTPASQTVRVPRILTHSNPANAHALWHVLARWIAALTSGHMYVFGPPTTFGKDLTPGLEALRGAARASDVMSVEGVHNFKHPIDVGNALIAKSLSDYPAIGTGLVRDLFKPSAKLEVVL